MVWIFLGVILIIIIAVVAWAIGGYNNLIRLKENVNNAMAQIAAQVESRWDALSNLIGATKQYAEHESETLENVIKARSGITSNASAGDVERDEALFQEALVNVRAVAEQYPDLKAAGVYQKTMADVNQYENQVRQSRMIFNDTVTKYNRAIKLFPTSVLAGMFNFTSEEYFQGSEAKADMPMWD